MNILYSMIGAFIVGTVLYFVDRQYGVALFRNMKDFFTKNGFSGEERGFIYNQKIRMRIKFAVLPFLGLVAVRVALGDITAVESVFFGMFDVVGLILGMYFGSGIWNKISPTYNRAINKIEELETGMRGNPKGAVDGDTTGYDKTHTEKPPVVKEKPDNRKREEESEKSMEEKKDPRGTIDDYLNS